MNRGWLYSLIFLFVFSSCENDEPGIPKPKGYFRLKLPPKTYLVFDSAMPYSFRYPTYAKIIPDTLKNAEPYWIDIVMPCFLGKIHLSYKKVTDNLAQYIEDSRNFVNKHIQKATTIGQRKVAYPENKVYGLIYDISGTKSASTIQFFVTDSTDNFVRGALYFNHIPNNDSIAPIIDYIRIDIDTMLKSFRWKSLSNKTKNK